MIVDILPVTESVEFFNQDDNEILAFLLGGLNELTNKISSENWLQIMLHIAKSIDSIYNKMKENIQLSKYVFN